MDFIRDPNIGRKVFCDFLRFGMLSVDSFRVQTGVLVLANLQETITREQSDAVRSSSSSVI